MNPLFFRDIKTPIKAIRIADDPLANETTFHKLLEYYENSQIEVEVVEPQAHGLDKIGHTGIFSRKMSGYWEQLHEEIAA